MTNLNLLSMTQRKALLNAVTDTSTCYADVSQQDVVGNGNRQAIRMVNFVGADEQVQSSALSGIESKINFVSTGDQVSIGGKTCGIEGSGIISDTYINNVQDKTLGSIKSMSATSSATSYKGMSAAELHKIKLIIYNLHHQNDTPDSGNGGNTPDVPGGGSGSGSGGGGTEDIPDVPGGGNEGGGDTPGTGEGEGGSASGEGETTDDPNYKSFITTCNGTGATFDTVNEMFTVLEEHGIDTSRGISRADLVKLSQDDTWEDSHWDFFGCLNRIFDALDVDGTADNYLSKEELNAFFPDGKIDENSTDYLSRVLQYSRQLEDYYQSLSSRDKVQYALEKTRQYLEAMGMQPQIDALDRLLSQQDYRTLGNSATSEDIIFGNIVFSDLGGYNDGYVTLGAYGYFPYLLGGSATYTVDGKTYNVSLYGVDHSTAAGDDIDGSTYVDKNGDTQTNDVGLTLNSNDAAEMLNKPWYYVVDTLVHELTHATAYQYVNENKNPSGCFNSFNYSQIEQLYNEGLITASEWEQFQNSQTEQIFRYDETLDDYVVDNQTLYNLYTKLMYLTSCKWGEYAAYQADADFIDSIGGDVMNSKVNGSWQTYSDYYNASDGKSYYVNITTAANGSNESSVITSHIIDGYGEQEALPNYKWWTNGDNGILA